MKPIHVTEIMYLVPHRPPMVWVDEVLSYSELGGECQIRLQQDGHYMSGNQLRPLSCLEFIAQGYGFCSVAYHRATNPTHPALAKAFLAAIKLAEFAPASDFKKLQIGDTLRIHISDVRPFGAITLFNGRVFKGADQLCQANLKVYSESSGSS